MPTIYTDPRDYVALKKIPAPSHIGLKITARCSSPVYTCEKPSRKDVAKTNFERRAFQTTQCGYKSLNYKPYKSVGEVLLDDKELILRALGQLNIENDEEDEDDVSQASSTELDRTSRTNEFINEEEKVILTQQKTEGLQTLHGKLSNGRLIMNKVRLGIGLFKLIQEEQDKKVLQEEKERIEEEEKARSCMRPASENQAMESDDENIDLSRFLAETPSRTVVVEDSSEKEESFEFEELEQKPSELCGLSDPDSLNVRNHRSSSNSSDVSRKIVIARWQRIGSMASQLSIEKFRRLRRQKDKKELMENEVGDDDVFELEAKLSPNPHKASTNSDISVNESQMMKIRKENSSTAKNKIARNKKYKNEIPRAFSPIFTNINFYETESREYTFRQLCVIHWILEAMSQDQQPVMPSISTCWKLKDLREDLRSAQKKVEREKAVDPVWKSFLTNPSKFSRGRTGRRGTLLQRRVSVAPSVLRLLSASSSETTSAPWGVKPLISNEGYNAESSLLREKSASRSRSSTQTATFLKESDESQDSDLAAKKIQSQKPVSAALRSFKEKAYTVRDVVIANNALNRRGSKMARSKSAPGSLPRRKSIIKQNMESRSTENNERDEQQDMHTLAWMQKDGGNMKAKFVAAAIATYGAISINKKADRIPTCSREKFEELSKENALVLHDNLELRERTNVESMEKKFLSLNVMSDVHKAINVMRSKSALKVETDEEKKARFSEECSWYKSLLDNLPLSIRADRNNSLVLDKIAKYGSLEGRKISSAQFLRVLSLLRSWELCYPDVSAGIEFVRDKVVKMDKREFEDWFQSRTRTKYQK